MIKNRAELEKLCTEAIDRSMELYDIPGVVIGVSCGDDECCLARGWRDFISKDPLKPEHIFHCASVSKLFTSAGILKLAAEGRLNPEERLADVLPEFCMEDRRYEHITILQMLTHTSAMGDVSDYEWQNPRIDEDALRDYVMSEEVKMKPLLWEPGSGGFRYSNIAYEILGYIVSAKSGMSYEDFMQNEFLRQSSMNDSTFLTFERTGGFPEIEKIKETGNMAMPHEKTRDRMLVPLRYYPYNRMHGPSSTLTTNAADLLKWARRNIKRSVFPEEMYNIIWKEYAEVPNNGEKMGLGWFIRRQEGYTLYGHEGTDDGFRASFWICPEIETAVTVLSNMSDAPVKKIGKSVFADIIHHL